MDRREDIIKAAVHLFHTQGYSNTSMQNIADAVGLLKGSLYYYISSKEDLLYEIHQRFMNVLVDKTASREAHANLPARERLEGVITDLVYLIRDYRAYVEVFFRERYAMRGPRWEAIHHIREQYEALVRSIVRQGQQEGTFRPELDAQIVTFGLFGMCNWTYQWMDPGGRLGTADLAKIFCSLLLDGLASDALPPAS